MTMIVPKTSNVASLVSKRDSTALRLPDYVFEWIGRTVAQRLDLIISEHKAIVAELKSENAKLVAQNVAIVASFEKRLSYACDVIDGRLSEIKDGRDGRDTKPTK